MAIFIKIQVLVQDQLSPLYNAVNRIFQRDSKLIDYRIDSVTEGIDAR